LEVKAGKRCEDQRQLFSRQKGGRRTKREQTFRESFIEVLESLGRAVGWPDVSDVPARRDASEVSSANVRDFSRGREKAELTVDSPPSRKQPCQSLGI